jgi:hypothetical protein
MKCNKQREPPQIRFNSKNHLDGIMVSVLVLNVIDHCLDPLFGANQTLNLVFVPSQLSMQY